MPFASTEQPKPSKRRTREDISRMDDVFEEAFKPLGGVPHPIGIPMQQKKAEATNKNKPERTNTPTAEPVTEDEGEVYNGDIEVIAEELAQIPSIAPASSIKRSNTLPPPPIAPRLTTTRSPLRAPTLPAPPPPEIRNTSFYLRGNTNPGHPYEIPTREEIPDLPSLEAAEDEPMRETDPAEISGPRSIPPHARAEAATRGHIEELQAKIARLHEDHKNVLDDLTHIVHTASAHTRTPETQTARREYAPLQRARGFKDLEPPPTRASWLGSVAKKAAATAKGWWENLTRKPQITEAVSNQAETGETLRTLEQAERDFRDLPTLFLTGRSLEGKNVDHRTLTTTIKDFETRIKTLEQSTGIKNGALEIRRQALVGESAQTIQKLLESPSLEFELEPEEEADLLILSGELKKRIHSLQATAEQHKDPHVRAEADQKLRILQKISGGSSAKQRTEGALLTCEAAIRLKYAGIPDKSRGTLSTEYQRRLTAIQHTLGLNGKAGAALDSIQNRLREDALLRAA